MKRFFILVLALCASLSLNAQRKVDESYVFDPGDDSTQFVLFPMTVTDTAEVKRIVGEYRDKKREELVALIQPLKEENKKFEEVLKGNHGKLLSKEDGSYDIYELLLNELASNSERAQAFLQSPQAERTELDGRSLRTWRERYQKDAKKAERLMRNHNKTMPVILEYADWAKNINTKTIYELEYEKDHLYDRSIFSDFVVFTGSSKYPKKQIYVQRKNPYYSPAPTIKGGIKKADATMVAGSNSAREKAYSEITTQFLRFTPDKMLYFNRSLCSGERFYILGHSIYSKNFVMSGRYDDQRQLYLPEGYYHIDNVFLTRESLKGNPYCDQLMKEYGKDGYSGSLLSINKILESYERKTAPFDLPYNCLFEVTSEATGNKYYITSVGPAMPVRSYEFHSEELEGKEVRLLYYPNSLPERYDDITKEKKSLTDVITGDYVPINSSKFRCVDFAVLDEYGTGYGATQMLVVLDNDGNRLSLRITGLKACDFGYVYQTNHDRILFMTEEAYQRMKISAEKLRKEKEAAIKKAEAKRKKELKEKYGDNYGEQIFNYKVTLGMTKEMVIEAWGYPETTIEHTNALGKVTVWSYGLNNFITFANGKVSSITQGSY